MSVIINNIILSNNLDGYILPKNDNYFTEYSKINNLKSNTNFSGSAGFAIFLKNKKYLFVDGRYTIQAEKEAGKKFEICEIPYVWPKNILKKKIKIGFDPDLFTWETLKRYFVDNYDLIPLNFKFFTVFDIISLLILLNLEKKNRSDCVFIFLNSIAHFQHNYWDDEKNYKNYFIFLDKLFFVLNDHLLNYQLEKSNFYKDIF